MMAENLQLCLHLLRILQELCHLIQVQVAIVMVQLDMGPGHRAAWSALCGSTRGVHRDFSLVTTHTQDDPSEVKPEEQEQLAGQGDMVGA